MTKIAIALLALLSVVPLYGVITTELDLFWQAASALGLIAAAFLLRYVKGRRAAVVLITLSIIASSRYLYWRFTQTLPIGEAYGPVDLGLAIGLLMAELYAYVILVLGYFQTIWPLERKPVPLPPDPDRWPTVDVFIPTYNEPLEVLRPTVLGALDLDWPKDKLRIYVLDDGRRDHVREFCESVGATHITRGDNAHAKAGNINAALKHTDGEYIAIFDCDHVPTRSFLQMTVGIPVADDRVALVQTPHHFFSPDPFERNLNTFRNVPNEGELFYGLIQDGNDFWDATFFCGSCAVLRREALEEIGGIATETVTEDAHTSLRMHSRGWTSAYLNLRQSAGLATESLSAHVGQRVRWARGMAQILRVDNPLLMRGLKLGQRLCYVNAMLHFFYGLPRVVFLTAPLAYLLLDADIINARGLMVAVYAAPHLFIAMSTNSRLQGAHRHSFWSEVYETVLATYITLPTLLAVINPKLGKFNVTAKGGIVEEQYFDRKIAKPYIYLFVASLIGFCVGLARFAFIDDKDVDTLALNLIWTFYNVFIVCCALAVAAERRQLRNYVRVKTSVSTLMRQAGQESVSPGRALDLSYGGCSIQCEGASLPPAGGKLQLRLLAEQNVTWIDGTVTRVDGRSASVRFDRMSTAQEASLVFALFGRADAWLDWSAGRKLDRPMKALGQLFLLALSGSRTLIAVMLGRARTAPAGGASASLLLACAMALGLTAVAPSAQAAGTAPAETTDVAYQQTERKISLKDIGIDSPIRLRTVFGQAGVPLSLRTDQIVSRSALVLKYAHSPSLRFDYSHINVLVNDQLLRTIPLTAETASGNEVRIAIDPRLWLPDNELRFELIAHYAPPNECEDPTHTTLWADIFNESYLEFGLTAVDLPLALEALPKPMLDEGDRRRLRLPFAFTSTPGPQAIEAAAVLASWFGARADYRGAEFPVSYGKLPAGHGVLFVVGEGDAELGKGWQGSGRAGVRLMRNPQSRFGRLLVVHAPNENELLTAAQAFALGQITFEGDRAEVTQVDLGPARSAWSSARWVDPSKPWPLEKGALGPMTASGLMPAPLRFEFYLPPDLYLLSPDSAEAQLYYRIAPVTGEKSALNVSLWREYVGGAALDGATVEDAKTQKPDDFTLSLPREKLSASNWLNAQYHFRRNTNIPCEDFDPFSMTGSIDPASELRFKRYAHFVEMPRLELLATGGYPFSEFSDLSRTALVLPLEPSENEVSAALGVVGHLARWTQEPAVRIKAVTGIEAVDAVADRDLIMVGGADSWTLPIELRERMQLLMKGREARLRPLGRFERLHARAVNRDLESAYRYAELVSNESGPTLSAMMEFESPWADDRSILFLTAGTRGDPAAVARSLSDSSQAQFIRGGLALVHDGQTSGYDLGTRYGVGELPFWYSVQRWFRTHPYLLFPLALLATIVFALIFIYLIARLAKKRTAGKKK